MLKTLGGDRLGSGNKMKVAMHNYERSTHNLGNAWRSTLAPGVLVPFYKKLEQKGDTWTIDTNSLLHTMPAIGPLFGSYKLQIDFFSTPIRLYQGLLHNNWTKIGMDMAKVKLPTITLKSVWNDPEKITESWAEKQQINPSALLRYLGIKGLGSVVQPTYPTTQLERTFTNSVPILAYYDIFKQYYANKQENNAYVIDNEVSDKLGNFKNGTYTFNDEYGSGRYNIEIQMSGSADNLQTANTYTAGLVFRMGNNYEQVRATGNQTMRLNIDGSIYNGTNTIPLDIVLLNPNTLAPTYVQLTTANGFTINYYEGTVIITIKDGFSISPYYNYIIGGISYTPAEKLTGTPYLKEFPLERIDNMRMEILKDTNTLGNAYSINTFNKYPYLALHDEYTASNGKVYCKSKFPMQGLCVKTYQSDVLNNWLSKEWIDGTNGISEVTAVDTSSGSFTIDALTLAKKVYNMLNRIAVSGGTYQDWQEAVFGEDASRMAESPIYCGGMSGIIAFEEVVSTADTDTAAAGDQPLGSLAGKGILTRMSGGHIEIHTQEPSYLIGIVSITPYIDYVDDNDFDMTEIESLNDVHKPALDGIGFQNLSLERACWFGKTYDEATQEWKTNVVGKQPAWIEYMTSKNQVFGDFADPDKLGFMVLARRYEYGNTLYNGTNQYIPVKDFTTYINPAKWNYQFADASLEAQNFWVQIGINAISRRKMSAKLMPNL